jgi:hypothetical protein
MIYFKVLVQYFPGGSKEHEKVTTADCRSSLRYCPVLSWRE